MMSPNQPGIGVDAQGGAVIDPTKNVLDLVEAANRRQDDLRALNNRRIDASIEHLQELSKLRADHQRQMDAAESSRLDSIRQIDVLAVNTAAERALAALKTLETTTASNAENLRTALTNTATTIATQLTNTVAGINERLAALERSSYEGKGRSTLVDPQMAELVAEMKSLRESRATGSGQVAGISASWVVFLGVCSLIATLITIGVFLTRSTATSQQPQVIYTPAVPGTLMPQPTAPVVPR